MDYGIIYFADAIYIISREDSEVSNLKSSELERGWMTIPIPRIRQLALTGVLLIASFLTACGSDPTPTPVPPTATPTATPMAAATLAAEVATSAPPREPIVFSDLDWESVVLQNRIAQYIVEMGYGYPTRAQFGTMVPMFQGLREGHNNVTMEIWLPNQDEVWNAALEEGEVVPIGKSLGKDWQSAFVIPAYLQEQYPELDSVEDLKEQKYKDLFTTPESGGKARLVSCIITWACERVNAAQIEAYGLSEHVEIFNPADNDDLNRIVYEAYERQEPWLGYQWGTNDPALKLDLVRLEEPPYSDECWFTNKACGYEDATILIAVSRDLPTRAPEVIEMLRAWDFNIDIYRDAVRWQGENPDANVNATAIWWLNSNAYIWSGWITDEAAAAVRAALEAEEVPEGWPEG